MSGWDDGARDVPEELLDGGAPGNPDLFRRYSMAQLLERRKPFEWLVKGMLVSPTYGQIAGEMKTLKTHVGAILAVAVASGLPALGRFEVTEPRPVLIYVGEGGEIPYLEKLERIAYSEDVKLCDLPIETSFDVAPFASMTFNESLERDLKEVQPGLVLIDPLYAYHGSKTDAGNLHQEGAMLNAVSSRCVDAGASLLIVNHFAKTSAGEGLKRITQAGSGEWVDTWLLLRHRVAPDLSTGKFRLAMDVGSRRWGGTAWNLDMRLGSFDVERGAFDGAMSWNVEPMGAGDEPGLLEKVAALAYRKAWTLTRSEMVTELGGRHGDVYAAVDEALAQGLVTVLDTVRVGKDGRKRGIRTLGPGSQVPERGDDWGDDGG